MSVSGIIQAAIAVLSFTAGLVWALPAAGIGMTVGFSRLATVAESGLIVQSVASVRRRLGSASEPSATGDEQPPIPPTLWITVLGLLCAVVAYLGASDSLASRGYTFIPAVIPFLLMTFAVPGILKRA